MPRQGQKWYPPVNGKPGGIFAQPNSPVSVFLHAQTRFLDESSGNLAQYFDAQVAQAGQFPLGFPTCATKSWRSLIITITPWPNPSSGHIQDLSNRGHISPSVDRGHD
jgi:hypothetical protein